jgi:hypothetical protein
MKFLKIMLSISAAVSVLNVQAAPLQSLLYVERYTDLGGGQYLSEFGTLSEKGYLISSDEDGGFVSSLNNDPGFPADTLAAVSGKILAFPEDFKAASKKYAKKIVRSTETYTISDTPYVIVGLEPKIKLSAIDPTASETAGDAGQFLFSLNTPTVKDIRVKFTVAGTATKGIDYEKLTNYILIPAGNISGVIEILPIDDVRHEGTEKVTLKLLTNGIKGYSVGKQVNANVKIFDND